MAVEQKMIQVDGNNRVAVMVSVSKEEVSWTNYNHGLLQSSRLKFRKIIGTRVFASGDKYTLHLYYVKVIVNTYTEVVLRNNTAVFLANDVITKGVGDDIEKGLKATQGHRPRRLLVFVNPMSGDQDSSKVFQSIVEPLFNKAKLETHCVVTTDSQHSTRVLDDYDVSNVDAYVVAVLLLNTSVNYMSLVSMGGDGSYIQVFDAFMRKCMKEAHADMNDERIEPVKPPFAYGLLPGGSGNALARIANTCIDIETCAINIILGTTSRSDVSVVRHSGALIYYSPLAVSSAGFVNAFLFLEKFRWLGRARYSFLIPAMLWLYRHYDIEIQYHLLPADKQEFQYVESSNTQAICKTVDGPIPGWKTVRGKIGGATFLHSYIMKCFVFKTIWPYTKPCTTTGKYRILIETSQNLWDMFRAYVQLSRRKDTNQWDASQAIPKKYFEQIESDEVRVKIFDKDSRGAGLNLGDIIHDDLLEYSSKIYPGRFDMFVMNHDMVTEALSYETCHTA